MIDLVQQKQLLIGSTNDIFSLSKKDHCRILAVSDSHNHFETLLSIVQRFGPSCHCFAFCGDGLKDIATLLSLAAENEKIREIIPPVFAYVQGNCDGGACSVSLPGQNVIIAPPKQILNVNGHNIMIVHGHNQNIKSTFNKLGLEMKLSSCDTALFGHTHIAEEVALGDCKFVNPGSCGLPRDGQPPSCAILTVEKSFIDTAFINLKDFSIWHPN